MTGFTFIGTALYLTLLVAFVFALLQEDFGPALVPNMLRKWGKFLLGLVGLAAIVQILTVLK